MPLEIVGMVGTRDASEIKGPLVDGPVVDWTDGPVIDADYLEEISRAHEDAGFDRVLVGYGAVGPEGWAVASSVLHHTDHLKVLVAHRPGFVQPALLARKAATLDHLTGGGRIGIHFITGGDEADQRREGDFVPHDARYRRTGEVMSLVRRMWEEDAPFDFDGEFFRYEGAFTSVKPVSPGGIPLYFAGASPAAIEVGAAQADVYAFWGEPRAAVAERMSTIVEVARTFGRTPRFSISLRPIIADTEDEAWEKAEWIAEMTAERIELAKERMAGRQGQLPGPRRPGQCHLLGRPEHRGHDLGRTQATHRDVGRAGRPRRAAVDEGGQPHGCGGKLDGTGRHAGAGGRGHAPLLRPRYHHVAAEGVRSCARRHRIRQGAPSHGPRGSSPSDRRAGPHRLNAALDRRVAPSVSG